MALKEKVLWLKCICSLTIGVFTPWGVGLAQWVNSGQVPSLIIWLGVILPASLVGGANTLLSFLSSSFGKHMQEKQEEETAMFARNKIYKGTAPQPKEKGTE